MGTPSGPFFAIARPGDVEMPTDRFEESRDLFTRVFGLQPSAREG